MIVNIIRVDLQQLPFLPKNIFENFKQKDRACININSCILQSGYGMTEVSPIHFFSMHTDSEHLVTTTIGCVMEHTEVRKKRNQGEN